RRLLHDGRRTRDDRRRARAPRTTRPSRAAGRRRRVHHRAGALFVSHLEAGGRTMNVGMGLSGLLLALATLPAVTFAQGETSAVFVVRLGVDTIAVERATIGPRH